MDSEQREWKREIMEEKRLRGMPKNMNRALIGMGNGGIDCRSGRKTGQGKVMGEKMG